MDDLIIEKGKELAFLLRHDKSYKFDKHGYRKVSNLIDKHDFTLELLEEIINTNDKSRFEFNEDKTKIRARQGHSINVNVDLRPAVPFEDLFHGTATKFLDSIKEKGLIKGTRNHVHLSSDVHTAYNVGKRHGSPYILGIKAREMYEDGYKFYLSNNRVWLTEHVPVEYILF